MSSHNLSDTLNELIPILINAKPKNILVLYNGEDEYFKFFQESLQKNHLSPTWDSINWVNSDTTLFSANYTPAIRNQLNTLTQYDFIIIASLIENITISDCIDWVKSLLPHTLNAIIILESLIKNNVYHEQIIPLLFHNFNYIFTAPTTPNKTTRIHFIQPSLKYPPMEQNQASYKAVSYKKLNIAFWFSHNHLTGTAKNAVQLIKQLLKRGHNITIYRKGQVGEEVLPNWCDLDYSLPNLKSLLITTKKPIETCVEKNTNLIVICTIVLLSSIKTFDIPVILWEKGFRQLFGEFPTLERGILKTKQYAQLYRLPTYILSVSPIIKDLLKQRYNRDSLILPNGVDTAEYFPIEKKHISDAYLNILLVGRPSTRYKRLDRAITALDKLSKTSIKFKVNWICQDAEDGPTRPYIHYIIDPSQSDLRNYYRHSDILISTSDFESFSTPPLEALASGVSVVAVNNGGITLYGKDKINMLLCEQNDPDCIYEALYNLATIPELRLQLTTAGRKTALIYDYYRIALLAEQYFLYICENHSI